MVTDLGLDEEIKLYTNNKEREKYELLSDLYAIIVTMEHLEKAYIRDLIPHTEYTPACGKLIAQYKTAVNLVNDSVPDVEKFMKEYKLECPAAVNRFKIGVPATVEHSTGAGHDPSNSAQNVAETVQNFITVMDVLKLRIRAVDEIHPLLSNLMQSLNKMTSLPPEFEGKAKIRNWLITLNGMKAKYNYETLYSCILVSRSWFRTVAPILWKDPFHSKNSMKTMIRCLSKESKDFFVKNNIKLSFEVLDDDKLLLCNYSEFANELRMEDTLYDNSLDLIDEEIEVVKKEKWYLLLKELVKFIMTNSRIERIFLHYLEHFLLLEQPKFNQCFSNLRELACDDNVSPRLFHLLAQTTDKIEILGLEFYNYKSNMGLVELIRAQKHIKKLLCFTSNDSIPKLVKEALLLHANNLVEYTKKINVNFDGQDCVYTLSKFFKLNGKNLKVIQFDGKIDDILPTFEDLFCALMTALPQQIKILSFRQKCLLLDDVLEMFFKKWTGYAPIRIEIFNGDEEVVYDDIGDEVKMIELLTHYKEKGLLDFSVFDSIPKFDIFLESL
ncbi:21395_t:CDS:2 [Entrophospora sp. SA101]|nr:21395_t:CDS:2 [Entrophospora sp. SA101]